MQILHLQNCQRLTSCNAEPRRRKLGFNNKYRSRIVLNFHRRASLGRLRNNHFNKIGYVTKYGPVPLSDIF